MPDAMDLNVPVLLAIGWKPVALLTLARLIEPKPMEAHRDGEG
ncbi:hypothetical protein [Sphingomonas sp. DT-204]